MTDLDNAIKEIRECREFDQVRDNEQQILNKTIEYLNKYSNNFKKWRGVITRENGMQISAEALCEDGVYRGIDSDNPLTDFRYDGEPGYIFNNFNNEFRIAYNIIKDFSTA